MSDDSPSKSAVLKSGWLIFVIFFALLVWGSVISWGVIRNQAEFDFRKPLVMFAAVAIFLLIWSALLWRRKK